MPKTLLPAGCYDLLPPYARQESSLSAALLSVFEGFGYEQVSPPLLEYSENLLSGRGAALSSQIFRLMDPNANKVMGIRADITLQIARIAASRLAKSPRPLRLCYNGLTLRVQGEQLKGDRQLRQAGIELIGASGADADAEVILVAIEALRHAGIKNLSVDLNLPGIISALLANTRLEPDTLQQLFEAASHKDVSTVSSIAFEGRETLTGLMQSSGDADEALAAMDKLALPDDIRRRCNDLRDVVNILKSANIPDCNLTIDPTENRGLDYHKGISFSIFVPGASCEVGRGGRYLIENNAGGEEATGFTLYVETLRSLLPEPSRGKRILVADRLSPSQAAQLRADGFIVLFALSEYGSTDEEAARLGCQHVYRNGKIITL